jgi:hypothetical protein
VAAQLLINGGIGEVAFNLPSAATAGEEKGEPNKTACLREPVFAGNLLTVLFAGGCRRGVFLGIFLGILSDLPKGSQASGPAWRFWWEDRTRT